MLKEIKIKIPKYNGGFEEYEVCERWNDEQIKFGEILKVIDYKPLFGDKRGKTRWTVFMKENQDD